ncbi:MAG: hypothetical protein IJZ94_02905 [Clostridia bacterium]|nr:hypothetical protein [Clostridia bacterium]
MDKKVCEKISLIYLIVSVICAVFGAVYEKFSHGVYSYSMIYAFLFPLIGGALVWSIIGKAEKLKMPGGAVRNLYHSGIASFTVGSIFNGIIEIYGTESVFVYVYMITGIVLFVSSIIIFLIDFIRCYEQ